MIHFSFFFLIFSDLDMGDSAPSIGGNTCGPADYDYLIKFLALGK